MTSMAEEQEVPEMLQQKNRHYFKVQHVLVWCSAFNSGLDPGGGGGGRQ